MRFASREATKELTQRGYICTQLNFKKLFQNKNLLEVAIYEEGVSKHQPKAPVQASSSTEWIGHRVIKIFINALGK
jgi:hypothetical protein